MLNGRDFCIIVFSVYVARIRILISNMIQILTCRHR